MDQPTADAALRELERLAGEWRLTAVGATGEAWPGESRSSFERHPSGAYLVQRTTIDLREAPNSTSIIGCDAANGTYCQLYSDDRGVCRIYAMTIDEREWTLSREGQPFRQRFAGRFEAGGRKIVGRWEKAEDGEDYTIDFELTYTRIQ